MTRRRKGVVAAAGAVALAVGFGGGALAASGVFSPEEESKAVIEDAAGQLGVEPQELSDALKQALKNRIDAAVEAGRLTEEQANELKERIDDSEYPLLFGPGWHHDGFGGPRGFGLFGSLDAAASYLGLTGAELRERLQDQTLAEIAKDEGKSVSGLVLAIVKSATARIDEAVNEGRLTQEQASKLKAGLQDRVEAFVNGELRGHAFGPHPGFGSGDDGPRGPPGAFGPRA